MSKAQEIRHICNHYLPHGAVIMRPARRGPRGAPVVEMRLRGTSRCGTTNPMTDAQSIPKAALILGLAGVLPFAYGALSLMLPAVAPLGAWLLPDLSPALLLRNYGIVILCFMAGVIWGFAVHSPTQQMMGYALAASTIPALVAFFLGFGPAPQALPILIMGFLALLPLDAWAMRAGLAPPWWLRLRGVLSGLVIACLIIGVIYA